MEPIILASSSPRRQEILQKLGIPFVVHPANISETVPRDIAVPDGPEFLAARKVDAVIRSLPPDHQIPWVLGADTAIYASRRLYGKPKDRAEAVRFLRELQGKKHDVVTAVALFNGQLLYLDTRSVRTKVTFAPMSDAEIEWYVNTGEWHEAAGAYRIQGMGSCFIKKIEGSESAVMGLPIFELYDMLKTQGYPFLA